MTTPLRKILIGAGLTLATLTGGAIGASFMGTASAQTNDTTTTAPAVTDSPAPAAGTANPPKENCPHDGTAPDAGTSSSSSSDSSAS